MDKHVHYDSRQDLIVFSLAGETSEWVEAAVTGQALARAYGCGEGEAARLKAFADHEQQIRNRAEQLLDEGQEPLVKEEDLAPRNQSGAKKEVLRGIGEDDAGAV
ncbi:Protein of uncharacterised function (DUF1488) [Bordetella ansorpii]|uniref:Protein of uncharacterized function (DUF1488) n=1 Tax=Bordetella ansorpii TaxID=288768 RepID=A0A157SLT9_9BORD|nr:DUF1488 family protein [Bordetella ansorpii]SAI71438.1 Protein of uncharacterised function (DUF1488) [Bordetella ansorpii]